MQRYPIEHTRFSKPLPSDSWWHHPKAPHALEPGAADINLRSWLFAFGGGNRIDGPDALRQELLQRCQEAMAANHSEHTTA